MAKRKRVMKFLVIVVLIWFILSSWILTMFMYRGSSQETPNAELSKEVQYSWIMTGSNNTGSKSKVQTGSLE